MGRKPAKMEVEGDGRRREAFNPMKRRSCTDVLCLLLFVVFIAGWVGVAYVGISKVRDIDPLAGIRTMRLSTH
jgi:hypothetical protein